MLPNEFLANCDEISYARNALVLFSCGHFENDGGRWFDGVSVDFRIQRIDGMWLHWMTTVYASHLDTTFSRQADQAFEHFRAELSAAPCSICGHPMGYHHEREWHLYRCCECGCTGQLRQCMGATFHQFKAAANGGPPAKLFYHLDPAEREPICDEAERVAVREGWIVPPSKGAK